MNANYVESAWQERLHLLLLLQNKCMNGEEDEKDVVQPNGQQRRESRYIFIITDVQSRIIS